MITIIVPVFNEEESIIAFTNEMTKFLDLSPIETDVLFVNDGSGDNSLNLIKSIAESDERYNYISLATNSGLSAALKAGIDHTNTPFIGYIDADLQTTPMDFMKYFDHIHDYALINGIRVKRNDSFVKRLSSKIANGVRKNVIKDGIADTCCPLKIINTTYAKKIPFFKGMHRFMPALVQLQGGKVKQIEVQHFPRFAGTAKYHLLNRLFSPLIDMFVFVWMRNRNISYEIAEQSIMRAKHIMMEEFENS